MGMEKEILYSIYIDMLIATSSHHACFSMFQAFAQGLILLSWSIWFLVSYVQHSLAYLYVNEAGLQNDAEALAMTQRQGMFRLRAENPIVDWFIDMDYQWIKLPYLPKHLSARYV